MLAGRRLKLAVFGATGRTGQHIVTQALAKGHHVTAHTRSPEKLTMTHDNLTVVEGDALDYASVEQVVIGQDAILSGIAGNSLKDTDTCTETTANIIKAMNAYDVKRLITVSAIGVGKSRDQLGLVFRYLIRGIFLKNAYADHEKQELLIKESGLDWVIVRPTGLNDKEQTGDYRVAPETERLKNMQISRADVAEFCLKQLNDDTWLRQAVSIA